MFLEESEEIAFESSWTFGGIGRKKRQLKAISQMTFKLRTEATITGAKSMKGTPYWMAPEDVRQTSHRISTGIWSVGCTAIEMAMARPPWNKQYEEFAALYHIATTKYHPPIVDHLFVEEEDFL